METSTCLLVSDSVSLLPTITEHEPISLMPEKDEQSMPEKSFENNGN